jgi:NIMA (never in mitosis gene a)-related kinase
MEYCKNKDLRQYIEKHNNNKELIDEKEIIFIISEICNGLKAIHNENIMHRDLKPENIFISEDFTIKIGDFGIAKQINIFQNSTTYAKGTFEYMAPEMLQEKPKCNKKVDIWSFGCIIYELCTLE